MKDIFQHEKNLKAEVFNLRILSFEPYYLIPSVCKMASHNDYRINFLIGKKNQTCLQILKKKKKKVLLFYLERDSKI